MSARNTHEAKARRRKAREAKGNIYACGHLLGMRRFDPDCEACQRALAEFDAQIRQLKPAAT